MAVEQGCGEPCKSGHNCWYCCCWCPGVHAPAALLNLIQSLQISIQAYLDMLVVLHIVMYVHHMSTSQHANVCNQHTSMLTAL